MAWSKSPKSIEYTDDEKFDRRIMMGGYPVAAGTPEPPDYPTHCCMTVLQTDLCEMGCDNAQPGHEMRFSVMGTVTSTDKSLEDCRIEIEVDQMAGEDGKFCELTQPVHLCLCGPELEKIEMDDQAERGDMVHLIGRALCTRVMANEYAGDVACLQIVALTYEDESAESREG